MKQSKNEIVVLGECEVTKGMIESRKRVYSIQSISPTVCGAGRGQHRTKNRSKD